MKVLFISPSPIFGGASTATISVAELLQNKGVEVIYNDEYDVEDKRGGLAVDHYQYHGQRFSNHHNIRKHIIELAPDIIVWSPLAAVYFYRDIKLLHNKGIKHVGLVHSLSLSRNLRGRIMEFLVAHVLHILDAIVFVSNYTLCSWLKFKPVQNCRGKRLVIHNTVTRPASLNKCTKPVNIGFVGRFSSEKQPGLFCSLQAELAGDFQLHAWGDGPMLNECMQMYPGVIYHGQETKIESIYQNIDILVMTSEFENCPMVILESKVRGIPCVAPNVGGIPEIVLDGFDGILYKKYDLHEIKQAIETIRANYVYYMNNSLRESKKYSFEEISEYWLHLFTSI